MAPPLTDKPTPGRSATRIVYDLVRVALLVGITGYLAWRIASGWPAIRSLSFEWRAGNVMGAVLAALIGYQCLFAGWLLLLRRSGLYRRGQTGRYARAWWYSFLYRYVPGKVLLLVERVRMGAQLGIPHAAGASLTFIESILSILAGSAVSLLALSLGADGDRRVLAVVAVLAVATVFVFPIAYRSICGLKFVRARFPDLELVALKPADILVAIVPYLLYYLLLGLSFFLLARGLNLFSWSLLPAVCGIFALSHVISIIVLLAPGGLGVREGALAIQLASLVPAGVAEALAIGIRVWLTLVELSWFAVIAVFAPPLPTGYPDDTDQSRKGAA